MFQIENSALLVVDVQGRLAHMMHHKEQLFEQVKIMIAAAEILTIPVFWMEQYPKGLGATVDEIKQQLDQCTPYEKLSFSSCGQAQFISDLHASGRRQIIVTGIETHVCVYQTVIDLLAVNYQVAVNQDAVSSRTQANKQLGLERMQQAGAVKTSTEMILFELMKSAEHPRFKQVSQLLK